MDNFAKNHIFLCIILFRIYKNLNESLFNQNYYITRILKRIENPDLFHTKVYI